MVNVQNKIHALECGCFKWNPIFAGALTAIGLSFLLNLFSVAIGLTAYTTDSQGVENIALGGLIATCLGVIVSMFASGWLAGYLASRHCIKRHLGAFYGFLVWCVALVLMVFLAEHIHRYIAFYTHFISGTTVDAVSAANAQIQSAVTGSADNKLVISAYIVFVLFFLSAFACSLGGHCGMQYVNKDERVNEIR